MSWKRGVCTESEIVSGSVVLVVDVTHGEGAEHLDAGGSSHYGSNV